MGFIDTSTDEQLPIFYNLVKAVGDLCPNSPDDVKVVQYLLMAFYEKMPEGSRPKGDIGVTGFCGPATRNWIVKFQLDATKQQPGKIALDRRIDRVREKSLIGSMTKTLYSLAVLNYNAAYYNPEKFVSLPNLVPLQNINEVPPPSPDTLLKIKVSGQIIIKPENPNIVVPETGGV